MGQKSRVYVPGKPLQPSVMLLSSLLFPFLNYEVNKVFRIQLEYSSKHFILFWTYKWTQ